MESPESTCWTLIRGAAAGDSPGQEAFARRYAPVVRAYLLARWKGSRRSQEVEDSVQEVFLECFRDGGVLDRVEEGRRGGFRAFLFGVIRNVALRVEAQEARNLARQDSSREELAALAASEESLSRIFDRAWAEGILREAAERQAARAADKGPEALRRVHLLRLRFQEALPIREIAARFGVDPDLVHRQYEQARIEFREALLEVIRFHHPAATRAEVETEALELLRLLRREAT